ncbi:MAG: cytochrome b/b6 domain-containing protein [Alphaproteobacteria bacterium]|nr:cytochrome b/b6 domain-containing protein [Alphaproteobacteria bacterium]MBU1514209.1 cytochrome b/b6 domain-containing protein [Alphaproteobacteria bacterium]MBU2095891.1 cytochrome b/b6 domain-containing protein [Alphaproteobacteria bacterium]MBU2151625.1 cytochrome b/b6 domain-containing protein [Alphaproteobacteria bacterium]MBU2307127.1 cytochrome b/b6 domain-containing protein [Alphaproteobacteria bacterium]
MADKPAKVLIRRHSGVTRITHWLNVLAVSLLLMSGLQIFNAHPALYWGAKSTFAEPWVSMKKVEVAGQPRGITTVGDLKFDTTGLFGWSGPEGRREQRGFPAWATVPSWRDLGSGRSWHFFFAWIFVINGLVYWLWGLAGGHVRRDLLPTRDQMKPRHILHEIVTHARLQFPKGEAARRYNVIQKLTYLAVIAVLLPLMVLTGLCMSPTFNATVPQLIDLFGGRQSARTIHFLSASGIVLFIVVHLVLVVVSGLWNNLRSMITGRYAIDAEGDKA